MDETNKIAEKKTLWLLDLINCKNAKVGVDKDEKGVINIQIDIPKESVGLLIGFHGENISSLQTILSLLINKGMETWNPVLINIGDYREKRNQSLVSMANNAADRVKQTGKAVVLPYLSGSERRVVHMALSEDELVETYSQGVGRDRRLTVNLRHN
jgi:spoIIIJ-associated protein